MYHHFQQYFSYIVGQLVAVSFIGGGNPLYYRRGHDRIVVGFTTTCVMPITT
jgi:hypothetical protein